MFVVTASFARAYYAANLSLFPVYCMEMKLELNDSVCSPFISVALSMVVVVTMVVSVLVIMALCVRIYYLKKQGQCEVCQLSNHAHYYVNIPTLYPFAQHTCTHTHTHTPLHTFHL